MFRDLRAREVENFTASIIDQALSDQLAWKLHDLQLIFTNMRGFRASDIEAMLDILLCHFSSEESTHSSRFKVAQLLNIMKSENIPGYEDFIEKSRENITYIRNNMPKGQYAEATYTLLANISRRKITPRGNRHKAGKQVHSRSAPPPCCELKEDKQALILDRTVTIFQ